MSPSTFPEVPMLDRRPAAGHHHPGYAPYLDALERALGAHAPESGAGEEARGSRLLATLAAQPRELEGALAGCSEAQALHRYAPGKWSVKEVVGHLIEVERVMAYRLLRVSRGDATPLPGFEEDEWIAAAEHDRRALEDLLAEFRVVRAGTMALLRGLREGEMERTVVASGHPVSGLALAWIMGGHVAHHLAILHDRYEVPYPPSTPHLPS